MKRRKTVTRRKKEQKGLFKWFLMGAVFLGIIVLVYLLKPKYWNSHGKLAVVGSLGQDVVVFLYDAKGGSRTDIVIPANTQVLAAYGLGTWKLGSLWKLGSDEKIGGSLMVRTIALNFGFPVFVSQERLSVGDRLRMKIFSLVNRNNKDTIFLKETGFLKKTVFMDGEKGYVVNSDVPEEIISLFSNQEEFGSQLKAKIIDATGSYGIASKIGKIIETMGIKVASISKDLGYKSDCKVVGKESKLVAKVFLILGCSEKEVKTANAFDLEIYLGEKFTQGF